MHNVKKTIDIYGSLTWLFLSTYYENPSFVFQSLSEINSVKKNKSTFYYHYFFFSIYYFFKPNNIFDRFKNTLNLMQSAINSYSTLQKSMRGNEFDQTMNVQIIYEAMKKIEHYRSKF